MTFDKVTYENLKELKKLAQTLREESKPIDDHGDTQSYYDCWGFFFDDLDAMIAEVDEKTLCPQCEAQHLSGGYVCSFCNDEPTVMDYATGNNY